MKSKLISIIVATYNRENELSDLLYDMKKHGILEKQDIEVIIIDNYGKNENVVKLCLDYDVIYIKETEGGESVALNTGLKNSTGKFIINTDDDVIVTDNQRPYNLISHFANNPKLGYASGNVLTYESNDIANTRETKGGLSKGSQSKYYSQEELHKNYKFIPWPINKIAAGANNAIPREVMDKVGPYATFLGGGSPIGHANSLEYVYRIIRSGYDVMYDAETKVYHKHPRSASDLQKKLFTYGIGNSAYQLYIFFRFHDYRSLYRGLLGHHLYVLKNLKNSIIGTYPLSPKYTIYSLLGSLWGTILFFLSYPLRNRSKYN